MPRAAPRSTRLAFSLYVLCCSAWTSSLPAARIALTVSRNDALPVLDHWHFHTAIPMPPGSLRPGEPVELRDAKNRPIPCQFEALATWHPSEAGKEAPAELAPRTGIRWLGLDFAAPLSVRRQNQQFFVHYGDLPSDWKPTKTMNAVRGVETDEAIDTDNGLIRFTVKKQRYNFIDELSAGGRQLIRSASGLGAYATRSDGTVCWSGYDASSQVVVEKAGPMLTVIRAAGWHRAEKAGLQEPGFCKYVVRIYAYADVPYVKVQHTWIATEDSDKVQYGAFGLFIPRGGASALADGTTLGEHESLALLIKDWQRFELLRIHPQTGETVRIPTGGDVSGGDLRRGPIGFCLRDLVQNYPKEIELSPMGTWLHFWPKHGVETPKTPRDLWRLWFAHEGRLLDFKVPDTYRKPEYANRIAEPSQGNGYYANAMGVAKTHELLLVAGEAAEDTAQYNAAFQTDPGVSAGGAWNCGSGVLGRMQGYAPEAFPFIEDYYLAKKHEAYLAWRDRVHDWGMWTFGETHHQYGHQGPLHRRLMLATHYSMPSVPWLFYLRSGKDTYLQQGRRNTLHLIDVDICHHATPAFSRSERAKVEPADWAGGHSAKAVGGLCGYWGYVHWHAGTLFGFDSLVDYMLYDYYLTGNLRAWDVAREHGEYNYRVTSYVSNERQGDGLLNVWLDMYLATWDPKYWQQIRKGVRNKTGTSNWQPWYLKYLRLVGNDPVVESRVLEWADTFAGVGAGAPNANLDLIAEAHRLTRHPKYVAALDRYLRHLRYNEYVPTFDDTHYQNTGDAYSTPGLVGYTMRWALNVRRLPYAMKVLKEAGGRLAYDVANPGGGACVPFWRADTPKRIKHLLAVFDNPGGTPVELTGRFTAGPFWLTAIGPRGENLGRQDFLAGDANRTFRIPDAGGQKGLYAVYFGGIGNLGYSYGAPQGPQRLVFVPDDVPLETSYVNLFVPQGTRRFVITYSGYWYAYGATLNILDPAGNVRFRDDVPSYVGMRETRRAEIAPAPEETGKVWMLAGQRFLLWRIEGIPEYVTPRQSSVIDAERFGVYLRRLRYGVLPQIREAERAHERDVSKADRAALADPAMNGVMKLLHYEQRVRHNRPYGKVPGSQVCYETAQRPGQYLEWLSVPVSTKALEEGEVAFTWIGAMSPRPGPARPSFVVTVNGRNLVSFTVTEKATTWDGKTGAKLSFEPRPTSAHLAVGAFRLIVPAPLLEAGKPARIRVHGPSGDQSTWFGIYESSVRKP